MRQVTNLLIILFTISGSTHSQISIKGPQCVTTETIYQYNITGIDSASGIQVCVNNGRIESSANSCINSSSTVRIIWDSLAVNASISVSSSVGNSTLNISIRPLLRGGQNTANSTQTIDSGSVPQSINCSNATGGDCNPAYEYQWQQSSNRVVWEDMKSKRGQNLNFQTPLSQPIFYRRKVTETNSGTIKFSDIAAVYIIYSEEN